MTYWKDQHHHVTLLFREGRTVLPVSSLAFHLNIQVSWRPHGESTLAGLPWLWHLTFLREAENRWTSDFSIF
jgi:hypothetical protein